MMLAVVQLVAREVVGRLDPRHQHLPPPPSESVRSQLGPVRLAAGHPPMAVVFTRAAEVVVGPAGGRIVGGREVWRS